MNIRISVEMSVEEVEEAIESYLARNQGVHMKDAIFCFHSDPHQKGRILGVDVVGSKMVYEDDEEEEEVTDEEVGEEDDDD
jgi:hypothetical protein